MLPPLQGRRLPGPPPALPALLCRWPPPVPSLARPPPADELDLLIGRYLDATTGTGEASTQTRSGSVYTAARTLVHRAVVDRYAALGKLDPAAVACLHSLREQRDADSEQSAAEGGGNRQREDSGGGGAPASEQLLFCLRALELWLATAF